MDQERLGRSPRISAATASARARDLEARLAARMRELDVQETLTVLPPVCVGTALVLAAGLTGTEGVQAVRDTKAVERRAVEAVLAAERALGRTPVEMSFTHPGYDVMSQDPDGDVVTIEVKERLAGADDVTITKNEVLMGKNRGTDHRLALVAVHPDGPHADRLVYLVDPFGRIPDPGFSVTRLVSDWRRLWEQGVQPL